MRKVLEVLRLTFEADRSQHVIACALGLAQSTVGDYVRRFRASGGTWPIAPEIESAVLAERLITACCWRQHIARGHSRFTRIAARR